jgi:hypothetical protein
MASISISTTATVGAGATTKQVKGGTALVVGEAVYQDTTTKKHLKAQANAAAAAVAEGVAVTPSGDGQEMIIVTEGLLQNVAGLQQGMWYVLSDSVAGDIMPVADLTAGKQSTLLGYAPSATSFYVKIVRSGVAVV